MGKSDKKRAQKTLDTQSQTAQNYMRGVQGQSGNLYNQLANLYLGPQNVPQPGTAIPRGGFGGTYQPTFPGNGTGGRTNPNAPGGNFQQYNIAGGQPVSMDTSTVQPKLMQILNSAGAASPEALKQLMPQIQAAFPGTILEDSDEIIIPGYGRIDVGGGFEGQGSKRWTFQSQLENLKKGIDNSGGGQGGIIGQQLGDYKNIMGQYQNWADTGGLSEQDKANLRNRATSPLRAMYSRGMQDLSRQRSLQGGYSPGSTTAITRLNRNLGQGMADTTTNAEAAITEMMQKGKQFGMGGMSGMYGATPGLADMFGRQVMGALGNQTNLAQLQSQLGNWITQNQIQQGGMQGFPWAKTLGTIGSIAAAIPTGGASLAALPAMYSAGGAGGAANTGGFTGFAGGGYI